MANEARPKAGGRARVAIFGVAWSAINAVLPTLAGFIVFVVASRVVSVAEFGVVSFAVVVVGIASAIAPAGFGEALIQRSEIEDDHLNSTFWLCLLCATFLFFGLCVSAGFIGARFSEPGLDRVLPVVGVRLLFDLAAVVPNALLSRRFEFKTIAMRTLWASVASLVVCLAFIKVGLGYWALVFSQISTSIVSCVVAWLAVDWRPSFRLSSWSSIKDLSKFGIYATGTRFINAVSVDGLIVGALMGGWALGIYSFANRVYSQINSVLTSALTSVTYPLMASMQEEREKLRELFAISVFLSSAVAFPVYISIFIYSEKLIGFLFGSQWLEAAIALKSLCCIGLLSCIGVLQASLIRALGGAGWWMWYQVVQQALTAGVVLVAWRLGIDWVAVLLAVKTWLVWPVTVVKTSRILGISVVQYFRGVLPVIFSSLVMVVVNFSFDKMFFVKDGYLLILSLGVGLVFYFLSLCFLSGDKLRFVFGVVRARRAKMG